MASKTSLPGISLPGISVSRPSEHSALLRFAERRAPSLALVAVLMLAGWLITAWILYFIGQGSHTGRTDARRPATTANMTALGETIVANHLFGLSAVSAVAAGPSSLPVKLRGVMASSRNGPGAAILNTGQKDEFVRIGNEVLPGVVLAEVHATHVLLQRGGATERVDLDDRVSKGGGISPAVSRTVPALPGMPTRLVPGINQAVPRTPNTAPTPPFVSAPIIPAPIVPPPNFVPSPVIPATPPPPPPAAGG